MSNAGGSVAFSKTPWQLSSSGFAVIAGDDTGSHTVCWTATNAKERADPQNAANARLIAAAPDLLRALKQIETTLEGKAAMRLIASLAILKAEGRDAE